MTIADKRSIFFKNVVTLMTGTSISQAIPIIIMPLLTRLYTPDDFGIFALYFSILTILSVMATGRYELAILLPRKEKNAYYLMIISFSITVLFSLCLAVIVLMFNSQILQILQTPNFQLTLFLVPISVLIFGIYQTLYYWLNREREYKHISIGRVLQSSTMVSSQFGFAKLGNFSGVGLVLGHFLGMLISMVFMARRFCRIINPYTMKKPNRLKLVALAKRYINFPKFLLIAHLFSSLSKQLPSIFFNVLFTAATAGFYMIVQRAIGIPLTIVGGAIGDVFRQEASIAFASQGNCKTQFVSTAKKLALLSVIPFSLLTLGAPTIFEFVFGKTWAVAGTYAQILSPMFFFQFIASPLSNMYIIAEKQREELFLQILILLSVLLLFLLIKDIFILLAFLSVTQSLVYIYVIYRCFVFSKG